MKEINMNNEQQTPTTLAEYATALASFLQSEDRESESVAFVTIKEGSPEWVTEIVRAAHQGELPALWPYYWVQCAADILAELPADADEDTAQELLCDRLPQDLEMVTCTYHKMTAWLSAYGSEAFERMDEVREASCSNDKTSDLVTLAMLQHAEEVAAIVLQGLVELADAVPTCAECDTPSHGLKCDLCPQCWAAANTSPDASGAVQS